MNHNPNGTLHVYFDESIHLRGGFILGAYVIGSDADAAVSRALSNCGLQPTVDEFKSSARMSERPEQVCLRSELLRVLQSYRVGVLVIPFEERESLGQEALLGLDQIRRANDIFKGRRVVASFDRGVFRSADQCRDLSGRLKVDSCEILAEQDSRFTKGIQLADLVAHTAATMLLEKLGLVTKRVKAGENSGYLPDTEFKLGFELWTSIRWQFLHGGPVAGHEEDVAYPLVRVRGYGLRIAESCPQSLRQAAESRFAECYLGCIH